MFVASLAAFLASGALLPVLPRYVHGPLGAGDLTVGLVVGAFSLTAIVSRPWSGRLADGHGRRVVFAAGALVMSAGAAVMFLPAGVPGAVAARLVYGIGQGAIFTAGSAWVVDLVPEQRRGRAISWYGLSVWGGLSLGPVLGEALDLWGGYRAVWGATVVLPAVGALLAWRQLPDRPAAGAGQGARSLIAREALAPGAILALATVGYATLASFVGLLMTSKGVSHGAAVFPSFAAAVIGARLVLGGLPDRLGAPRTGILAAACEAAGLAIIVVSPSWPVAVGGAVLMGAAFAVLYPALALMVVERAGPRRRGAALGTFTALFDAGFGLGAPVAGAIASLSGYQAAFWFAVAAAGAALAASVVLVVGERRLPAGQSAAPDLTTGAR